ncbi:MAG: DUF4268 domain-containing protein [Nitrospira sp.]|nr:DUF4268 domain-containing protein [Nitrospira sp.]MCB9711142.1 DUF4268 domain-containing protein [Nitrospiraceae bacterium]
MVQKILRIPLREAFKHEAYDFTKWLQENIDVLNECLDLTLLNAEREAAAGDFSVDLIAEDEQGNKVIIENQLEKSNHDHLGKLITYLVAVDARAAVWIVSHPRPEHVSAITWLNESSSASFYLVKLEAIRIGESDPAPLLTLIVGPSEETRAVGKAKKEFEERSEVRYDFWSGLLERAKTKTKLHASISPSRYSWIGTGAGKTGLSFNYVIWEHQTCVELYIDRGKEREAENKTIFDALYIKKDEIEKQFGSELEWERLDNRRASRIRKTLDIGGLKDSNKWEGIQEGMVNVMIKLETALRPFIQNLKI